MKNGKHAVKVAVPQEYDENAGPMRPDHLLPPVLQGNGPVAMALATAAERVAGWGVAERLLDDLSGDFNRLCRDDGWASCKDDAARRQHLRDLLQQRPGDDQRSPTAVFNLLLAVKEGLAGDRWERTDTWDHYVAHHRAFDKVLGGAIPNNVRAAAADQAYDRNSNATAAEDWPALLNRLSTIARRGGQRLRTGFGPFDDVAGGLKGLTLLAGDTGVGKSALALFLAVEAVKNDPALAVLFYTMELPKDEIYLRLLSTISGISFAELIESARAAADKVPEAARSPAVAELLPRITVKDYRRQRGDYALTGQVVRKDINDALARGGVKRVLVVFDPHYKWEPEAGPGLADAEPPRQLSDLEKDDERIRLVVELQAWTCSAAAPAGFPILATWAVRKPDHPRNRLALHDVRGRSELVYSANCVLLLEPTADANPGGDVVPVVVKVAKNGFGGRRGDVPLVFRHTVNRFEAVPEGPGAGPVPGANQSRDGRARPSAGRLAGKRPRRQGEGP